MKNFVLSALALFFAHSVVAQNGAYWQQQVNYTIEVTLNDSTHELDGFITIDYKNNSPATLNYILFHLWPNAYQNDNTPFAKQLLENGNTDFHFSKWWQKGFMDKLDFKVNAEVCRWGFDTAGLRTEVAKVNLNEPLAPGQSVLISTPFHVKLPKTFSRLGHEGQSYQISQWYPKPAVYDASGWNTMPYLDQGEFYSEYGNYDVSITLPKNYRVGATGDLQNPEEAKWMDSLSEVTKALKSYSSDMAFPPSSKETKTIRYTQSNIHDFAWFADKRYNVVKGEVELPYSKNKVTTWALFTNNKANTWNKADEYLRDAIYYYSLWIGEYPYKQVTAVEGALEAGGGMEYPNVTVIGNVANKFSLDDVITHEVGHNWFYGLLGSNERQHPWMDEGINSYYEFRYLNTKYPNEGLIHGFNKSTNRVFNIGQYKHNYIPDLAYQAMARENTDQALEQNAGRFTELNYGAMVYMKSALIFRYLENYLGTETFDKVMKKYFEEWKYKHPQPDNLRAIFEKETGKNLSWFFDDLIKTDKKLDYKIAKAPKHPAYYMDSVHSALLIKNKGDINAPVHVSYLKKDSVLGSSWYDYAGSAIPIPDKFNGEADRVEIDHGMVMPEINRKNNFFRLNKTCPTCRGVRFQFLGSIENQKRAQLFFFPYLAWNNYDKTQIGIMLYNSFLPTQKFNFLLVPAIGTASRQFIGFGRVGYSFFPDKGMQRLEVGLAAKRFDYILFPKPLLMQKLEPFVHIDFKKKDLRSPDNHSLHMRSVIAFLGWVDFNKNKGTQRYYVNEIKYQYERQTTLNPLRITATMQQGNQFMNLQLEAKFLISYKRKNEGLHIRVFAGGFPLYFKPATDINAPLPKMYLSMATTNSFAYWLQKDYMLDENFVDRNGRDKYVGRQVALSGGAFRSITTFGATNKFLAAINLSTTTHRFFPIYPFVNGAVIVNELNKVEVAAEMGLSLAIVRDMLELHLPLVTTNNIRDNEKLNGINKWYQKFTFTFKVDLPRPIKLVQKLAGR